MGQAGCNSKAKAAGWYCCTFDSLQARDIKIENGVQCVVASAVEAMPFSIRAHKDREWCSVCCG